MDRSKFLSANRRLDLARVATSPYTGAFNVGAELVGSLHTSVETSMGAFKPGLWEITTSVIQQKGIPKTTTPI